MADEPVENSHEEEYEVESHSRYSELYKNTAVRVVGVIILIVLLVLAGRFIHHQLKKNDNTPTVTTTSPHITSTTTQTNGTSGSSSNSGSANSGSSSTNTQAQSSSQVPNTGPGDVVAIFLAVTFAGYLLHLAVADRKTN
jgi:cytoskeletal protein RodZ